MLVLDRLKYTIELLPGKKSEKRNKRTEPLVDSNETEIATFGQEKKVLQFWK